MRICLIGEYSSPPWKGSATNKVQKGLLKSLSKNIEVVFLFEIKQYDSYFQKLFGKIKINKMPEGIVLNGGIISLLILLKKKKVNILHFIVLRRYMIPIFIFTKLSSKLIFTTFHDTILFNDDIIKNKITIYERLLKYIAVKLSNSIFVYNWKDKQIIEDKFNFTNILVVKNGTEKSTHQDKPNSENIILYAGGIGKEYKGLNFLLDSLKLVKNDFKLVLCGENPENSFMPEYIGELNPEEFKILLNKCYLVVVPSSYEPFSLVTLEAMSSKVPVILTDSCGIAQYLNDNLDCLKVNYGDLKTLSTKIDLMLSDQILRENIALAGYKTSLNFSWDIVAQEYILIYKQLLKI